MVTAGSALTFTIKVAELLQLFASVPTTEYVVLSVGETVTEAVVEEIFQT